METANVVVKDILQEILVQAAEMPVQGVDSQTCIRYMNRYMTQLDADGISLGYNKITNIADNITIPDGAMNGLIYNVALQIISSYDIQPSQSLMMKADSAYKTMLQIAVQPIPTQLPNTLPIGSGNEGDTIRTVHFYPGQEDDQIELEQQGYIQLESNTDNEQ